MLSNKDIIDSIQWETNLIKHLASKITSDEQLEYQPSENQRSLKELLEYLTRHALVMTHALANKSFDREFAEKAQKDSEEKNMLTDFATAMDMQATAVCDYIASLDATSSQEVVDLFNRWWGMPVQKWILEFVLKQYTAYRMQLFQYLKAGLHMYHLNTSNVWMWQDPVQE